jgi:AraC-like DNA-binding protein
MTTSELFEEVKRITQNNLDLIRERIIPLSDAQKSWRKDAESWSINDIFCHLNCYADYYHSAFKKKILKTRFREPKENFLSSPLGRSAWKSMKLGNARNVKRKFKSPRSYNPIFHPELLGSKEVEDFERSQTDLLTLFENARKINIRKAKVAISISKIVRLRLGDAFLYVVYHNERHMQQALNLLDNPKFPQN